jgi:xanthosine utilization system XapX-like protein
VSLLAVLGLLGLLLNKICPFRRELRQRNATASVIDKCFFQANLKRLIGYRTMNNDENGNLFPVRQTKPKRVSLTQKEADILRLADRSGMSLEATAKLILLLRARKKAANAKKNQEESIN